MPRAELTQGAAPHAAADACGRAMRLLVQALTAHPDNPDYWMGYLEALFQAGQIDAAGEVLALARQQGFAGAAIEDFARRLRSKLPQGRPYLVLAPAYTQRSAGIRVLHTLCNELNACGHTAYLIFYRLRTGGGVDLYTSDDDSEYCSALGHIQRLPATADIACFRKLIDEAYVVYPEVLQGNPLDAPRVVRYVLNSPAANGYPMLEGERDFIVGFTRQFWDTPNSVATLIVEEPVFNDEHSRPATERSMDCTYVGKGVNYGACFRVPGSVSIERHWPAEKEALAVMLRNTRYFFTWDLVSQTNIDALMCGAIPVILRWAPFTPAIFETDFGPFPSADSRLDNGVLDVLCTEGQFEAKRRRYL